MGERTTSFRNPADVVREKTEPKPEIHEERRKRATRIEARRAAEFRKETAGEEEESPEGE